MGYFKSLSNLIGIRFGAKQGYVTETIHFQLPTVFPDRAIGLSERKPETSFLQLLQPSMLENQQPTLATPLAQGSYQNEGIRGNRVDEIEQKLGGCDLALSGNKFVQCKHQCHQICGLKNVGILAKLLHRVRKMKCDICFRQQRIRRFGDFRKETLPFWTGIHDIQKHYCLSSQPRKHIERPLTLTLETRLESKSFTSTTSTDT